MARLGIGPEAVRREVEQITGQGSQQVRPGQVPDTPQVRRLWPAVLDEAVARGDDYIGTEHVLLALFGNDEAAAAQILTRLGAGESEVRSMIADLLAESGPERSA